MARLFVGSKHLGSADSRVMLHSVIDGRRFHHRVGVFGVMVDRVMIHRHRRHIYRPTAAIFHFF